MNNIYWSGIRSFLIVVEYGSFTAAAEATGLSKAGLSQQVSALEASLGAQLLHRTTRKLRLTEVGQGYYQMCRQGMQQLDSAQEWVTQTAHALKGTIRMNAVGGLIGEALIAPLLIEFQAAHPEVEVVLDFSSQWVDLMSSDYDLVMRMGDLQDSSLIARRLHTITTRFVASPDFICRYGEIHHPDDLKLLPLVYGSVREWRFVKDDQECSVFAEKGFQIANGRVMYQAALAGLGVSRLADVYVQAAINQGRLVEVLPDWREVTPLSLISPPARYQLHRVRMLMDWLVERFEPCYRKALLGHSDGDSL
ncbi:MAG: LysR substrate-binding domain-containing protein [Chromatiales bacterium]|nr:LysR substrate-binding domain-containing protein [Chromatiales bacterium]